LNLLLVDDDRISIDILAEYIKPHLPYVDEIVCAYDGREAFDIILSTKPDIIVTDIRMPHTDGITLIKKIRMIEDYEPNIIIISGHSDFNYARDALKLHVLDYILKPIDQDELIEKISACIEEIDIPKYHEEDIVEIVRAYIADHLDESFTLQEISEKYHYNAAYLGRLFKKNMGCSFSDYVLKLRVIKAQSLLIHTHDTIKQISQDVGFKDPEHFSKQFKKVANMTPSQYRLENQ